VRHGVAQLRLLDGLGQTLRVQPLDIGEARLEHHLR
jgi:hypothetical protein